MKPNKPLSEYSTRALLAMRDYRYQYDNALCGDEGHDPVCEQEQLDLRTELAKREHIPNKVEAKVLRQQRGANRKRRRK